MLTLTLGEVQAGVRSKLKAFMKFHCAELQSSSEGMNEVNYTDLNSEIKFSLLSTSYISILNVIGMPIAQASHSHPNSVYIFHMMTRTPAIVWKKC